MPTTFIQRTAGQSIGLQLGQVRSALTTPVVLYSPDDGVSAKVEKVVVIASAAALASVFHDEDGTTYNENTALMYDRTMVANESLIFDIGAYMNNTNGNLAVRTSVANAVTFTAYGTEIRTRAR